MKDNAYKMPKKLKIILSLVLVAVILVSFTGGYFSKYLLNSKEQNVASEVAKIIEKYGYIIDPETGKVIDYTEEDIADLLVKGTLDQYSAYYTEEEYRKQTEQSLGNREGVGFSFYDTDNVVDVIVGGSPADVAGMKDGDKIVSAQTLSNPVIEMQDYYDIGDFIDSCESNQPMTFTVIRGEETLTFTISKQAYKAIYVECFDNQYEYDINYKNSKLNVEKKEGGMAQLSSDTVYIEFSQFEGEASDQLAIALSQARSSGKTKLILDLRDNGGGMLSVLSNVCAFLVTNGQEKVVVVHAKSKSGYDNYYSQKGTLNDFLTKIVVLANDNSASATECLIGAMLHYEKAFSIDNLVIEKNEEGVAKTYGKGIMQTTYPLITGGALKLTTAQIFLPDTVTSIHGKGFTPIEENATLPSQTLDRAIQILNS